MLRSRGSFCNMKQYSLDKIYHLWGNVIQVIFLTVERWGFSVSDILYLPNFYFLKKLSNSSSFCASDRTQSFFQISLREISVFSLFLRQLIDGAEVQVLD